MLFFLTIEQNSDKSIPCIVILFDSAKKYNMPKGDVLQVTTYHLSYTGKEMWMDLLEI